MRLRRNPRRGTALVITVGLLAVLAVVGFGFAVLARLHQEQSIAYRAATQIDFLNQAAIQYAIKDIRSSWTNALPANFYQPDTTLPLLNSFPTGALNETTDNPQCPWFVYLDGNSNPAMPDSIPWIPTGCYLDDTLLDVAQGNYTDPGSWHARYCNLRCSSYAIVHSILGDTVGVTNVRVLDSAAKINLNDTYDSSFLGTILSTLLSELGITNLNGADIISYRNATRSGGGGAGGRFNSLAELKLAILSKSSDKTNSAVEHIYDTLKPYVTIYSWPWDPTSVTGFSATTSQPDHSVATFPTLKPQLATRRSPININTAPRPVLVAILTNIKVSSGAILGTAKARQIADRIIRRRDPENPFLWRNEALEASHDFSAAWKTNWLGNGNYQNNVRNRKAVGPYAWASGNCLAWASYPLGPFQTWNEVTDFLYSLTDGSGPFAAVPGLTTTDVETVLAAVNPNAYPSFVPRDTWQLAYSHLKQDTSAVEQKTGTTPFLRHATIGVLSPTNPWPTLIGRDGLDDTNSISSEFCFSSKGRFEIAAKTFLFQKADFGNVTSIDDYTLSDSAKSWNLSPPQWRGYNVLIYDGIGKGQLRAIVTNTATQLVVSKWGRKLQATDDTPIQDGRSRYYIVGPGPLLDRTGLTAPITVTNTTTSSSPDYCCVLSDGLAGTNWEPNQWAGQRIVVYLATKTTGAHGEDTESIAQVSIQERYILTNTSNTITVTPALDKNLLAGAGSLSYIILGSFGAADHEAAVKAYDVVYNSSQKDFLDDGKDTLPAGCTSIVCGPNPCDVLSAKVIDDNRTLDGWLAIARNPITQNKNGPPNDFFLDTFASKDLTPDKNGQLKSGGPTVDDIFKGGCLFTDGLYLRDKATTAPTFSVSVGTKSLVTTDRHDGGFVSFWFRPDKNFISGGTRTLILIKGSVDGQEDLRLVYDSTLKQLQLVIRSLNDRSYTTDLPAVTWLDGDAYHPPKKADAPATKYQKLTQYWPDPGTPDATAKVDAWRPGQWHHIAFAWNGCANDTEDHNAENGYNTDSDAKTDWRDDNIDPITKLPKYELDNEVCAVARLWVDGQTSGCSKRKPSETPTPLKAFHLGPSPDGSVLQIGEAGTSIAGTIDCLVALPHADNQLNPATFNMPDTGGSLSNFANTFFRYQGYLSGAPTAACYTSKSITLTNTAGNVALGTVAWTGSVPYTNTGQQPWVNTNWPIRVQVILGATTSDYMPRAALNQLFLGEGGPLRDSTGNPIATTAAGALQYKVYLLPYYGDTSGGGEVVPPGWQTPSLEDITITYLGPVVYYYWR